MTADQRRTLSTRSVRQRPHHRQRARADARSPRGVAPGVLAEEVDTMTTQEASACNQEEERGGGKETAGRLRVNASNGRTRLAARATAPRRAAGRCKGCKSTDQGGRKTRRASRVTASSSPSAAERAPRAPRAASRAGVKRHPAAAAGAREPAPAPRALRERRHRRTRQS